MRIPVLVERLPDQRFRARAGDPFGLTAEGRTQTEALDSLRSMIENKKASGAWVVHLDVGNIDNPIMQVCGTLDPDDPMVQQWEKSMEEYRKERDKELDDL